MTKRIPSLYLAISSGLFVVNIIAALLLGKYGADIATGFTFFNLLIGLAFLGGLVLLINRNTRARAVAFGIVVNAASLLFSSMLLVG